MRKSEVFITKLIKSYLEVVNVNDLQKRGLDRETAAKEDTAIIEERQENTNLLPEILDKIY